MAAPPERGEGKTLALRCMQCLGLVETSIQLVAGASVRVRGGAVMRWIGLRHVAVSGLLVTPPPPDDGASNGTHRASEGSAGSVYVR